MINNYQTNSRIATQRLSKFIRKGNKENSELQLRDLFFRRAIKVWENSQQHNKEKVIPVTELFSSIEQSATPYISLKTRRRRGRGNQLKVKLVPLERIRGEQKVLTWLSDKLRTEGSASQPFSKRLERELELLSKQSNSQSTDVSGSIEQKVVVASNSFREKRDEIHRQAYRARPFKWKALVWWKNKVKVKK